MIQQLFDRNILVYVMLGLFGFGFLLKLMIRVIYSRLIKSSNNMATSKNKLMKNMKLKFETLYKLKIGVNNVDVFVDKYINKHKFCGIMLTTWENFSGQVIILCALTGSVGALLGLIYEIGKQGILSVFSVGILTSGLLIFFEGALSINDKKEIIRLNIMDYLENYLKARLEQEQRNPELVEEYKKEYLNKDNENNTLDFIAAADSHKQEKLTRSERREKKKADKNKKKLDARLEKQRRKEEKKATKIFKKQTKKSAKLKRKEDRKKKKFETKQEAKRLKREAKLEKIRIREEKRRQAEIKKTLKIEKRVAKGQEVSAFKTPAEERKENLKKEIQNRRGRMTVVNTNIEDDEPDVTIINKKREMKPDSYVNEVSKDECLVAATIDKGHDNGTLRFDKEAVKTQRKGSQKKKSESTQLDEQIIEDILKEYLA